MGRIRKLNDTLRAKVRELRTAGKSAKEIAAELGLSRRATTNAMKSRPPQRAEAGAAPAAQVAPVAPPPARVQVAPAPEAAPLPSPATPPAGATGMGPDVLEQLEAEGIDLGPRSPAGTAAPGAAGAGAGGGERVQVDVHPVPPGAAPGVSGEQLIEVSETIKGVNVLLQCERFKVKLPTEILEQLSHFSPGQRKALLIFAPYAAPYATWLIQNHEKVAGILFLVVLAAVIVGDAKTIKGLAPKPEEKPKTKAPAPAPEAAPPTA